MEISRIVTSNSKFYFHQGAKVQYDRSSRQQAVTPL